MRTPRILVAEDDAHIRQGLVYALESEGYEVLAVADGAAALRRHEREAPDLILLDIMMPERNGYDVCREIRRRDARVAILMLTAKGEEVDKVVGLELGADDYVTKPFGVRELLARVRSALRRSRAGGRTAADSPVPDRFRVGPVEVDRRRLEGRRGEEVFPLTPRELKLLELFYARPGEALSRDDLLNAAWGIDYEGTTRTLDQHIAQLRKKVEPDPSSPTVILTVHGVGYRSRG
ncbi:MAG: response regulator transcription factor [Deltaproteobacteria bacterium]|nr:response regulator transcription factor [Deltaproteobacteria bacterium]